MNLAHMIDHTLLKPEATRTQIEALCEEAKEFEFCSVCVNPTQVAYAALLLKDSTVKVCTVIGFPLGANTTAVKAFEAKDAVENGATEVDMVINIGAVKDQDWNLVREDIEAVVKAVPDDVVVKVIIEICLLDDEEIAKVSDLAMEAGADFVKTSTGFSTGGATVEGVKLMAKTIGNRGKVKASGGIRDAGKAKSMVEAGADRIGASAGKALLED